MRRDFRDRAACRDYDPELFFPIGDSGPALRQITEARSVCHHCPVRLDCLAWALETGQPDGVWGGHTAPERRALRNEQCRPAHPSTAGSAGRRSATRRR